MDIGSVLEQERLEHLPLKPAVTVAPGHALSEVVLRMKEGRTGCATVVEDGKVLGVFTERDFIRKVLPDEGNLSKPVRDFMTPSPHVLKPSDSVAQAIEIINRHGHRSIPVVDDQNGFLGLISVRTVINFLAEHFPAEVLNLPPHPEMKDETPEGG